MNDNTTNNNTVIFTDYERFIEELEEEFDIGAYIDWMEYMKYDR